MAYPNNNKLNIILSQTSESADNTGKFPFTERIISGSNLFIVTDSNGYLTASAVSTTSSYAISASYSNTASYAISASYSNTTISASYSNTASYLTTINNYTVNRLTASNGVSASSDSYFGGNITINDGDIYTTDPNFAIAHNYSGVNRVSIGYFPTGPGGGSIVELSNIKTYGTLVVSGSTTSVPGSETGSLLPKVYFTSSTATGSNIMTQIDVMNDTGSVYALVINATSLNSGSAYAISASKGIIAGTEFISTNISASALRTETSIVDGGTLTVLGNTILGDSLSDTTQIIGSGSVSGSLIVSGSQSTSWNNGAITVNGGVGISKDLHVSGSTFLYGDLTIYGTGSVVNISSSTIIIGDNRIQLNAGTPIERYAGIDVFDSGSGTFANNVTSSLLWDALNDSWLLVSNNQKTGAPLTQSSAIMIGGPSGSFGNESLLTENYIPKVQVTGKNLQNSALIDNGNLLSYTGTGISSSQVTASHIIVQYTGSITYATGVYITYTTGSFTTITITTGSSPGVGNQVPSSPTSTGLAGQINVDDNFIYVYTNQVWKRVPLSTWLA